MCMYPFLLWHLAAKYLINSFIQPAAGKEIKDNYGMYLNCSKSSIIDKIGSQEN